MEKMIFTLTEQMKDALQLLQRTVTVKKGSGGVYPEGVLFYKDRDQKGNCLRNGGIICGF